MPPKPTQKPKSQTAPKVGAINGIPPYGPPVPSTSNKSSQAFAALEALATTDSPAPVVPSSTAGPEAMKHVKLFPGGAADQLWVDSSGKSIGIGSIIEKGPIQSPGMALDTFFAKLVLQQEDQARQIKELQGAVAELKAQIAQLTATRASKP